MNARLQPRRPLPRRAAAPPTTRIDAHAADALEATRAWLEAAVIGLRLCPFAAAVHARGQVRWVLSRARDAVALRADLVAELRHLASADPKCIDTTLIVLPDVLGDFLEFNDFLDTADAALAELGLQGTIQIASFHPQYRFAGSAENDMGNYSNRSPHPTLHLLREASVTRAVAAFGGAPEAIYERNIRTLRRLGPAGWRRLFGR